jgi:hypothetical protein
MMHVFQIVLFLFITVLLTGCSGPEEIPAVWEDVKIGELAPPQSEEKPGEQLLKTINFRVFVVDVPPENMDAVNAASEILYQKPLWFNNLQALAANSFSVGFGPASIWDKATDILRGADGKTAASISLLLNNGQADEFEILTVDRKQDIFYLSGRELMSSCTVSLGRLALRIKAKKIPGSRGVCSVTFLPVFVPPVGGLVRQLPSQKRPGEVEFSAVGFGSRMGPGDFIFLAPAKYLDDQVTLGGLFFSREGYKPVVRTYLIVCTGIID